MVEMPQSLTFLSQRRSFLLVFLTASVVVELEGLVPHQRQLLVLLGERERLPTSAQQTLRPTPTATPVVGWVVRLVESSILHHSSTTSKVLSPTLRLRETFSTVALGAMGELEELLVLLEPMLSREPSVASLVAVEAVEDAVTTLATPTVGLVESPTSRPVCPPLVLVASTTVLQQQVEAPLDTLRRVPVVETATTFQLQQEPTEFTVAVEVEAVLLPTRQLALVEMVAQATSSLLPHRGLDASC
jgi:hypothetical protein